MDPSVTWYSAQTEARQQQVLDGLADDADGSSGAGYGQRLRAVSTLIELVHLARHPRARVPAIRALGRGTEIFHAVPALHAELHSRHPEVVEAALHALGRVGLGFGGVLVSRWLGQQDLEALPPDSFAAALMALARTGSPEVDRWAVRIDKLGLTSATSLHLALAEACSSVLLDEAREGLGDPETARAALLHLAVNRVPDLAELLAPLLVGQAPGLSLVAEQILAVPEKSAEDHVLAVLTADQPPQRRNRLARGLRRHPVEAVTDAFRALTDGIEPDSEESARAIRHALAAGIPALQDAAVALAERGRSTHLSMALSRAHAATPFIRDSLPGWVDHPELRIATAAIRAHLNLLGDDGVARLEHLQGSKRAEHRLEWVRLQQNAYRDRLDPRGRSALPHRTRQALGQRLRSRLDDDEAAVRELALFTIGNVGLTDLASDLGHHLDTEQPWKLRRAAATALSEFPAAGQLPRLEEALRVEPREEVVFRLLRALLKALESDPSPRPALAALAAQRVDSTGSRCSVLALAVIGACGDPAGVDLLSREAERSTSVAAVGAAVSALGRLGEPAGLGAVLEASRSPAPILRLRSAEALGSIGGSISADRLVDMVCTADEALDVRMAAYRALRELDLGAELVSRLAPAGLDDPLALPVLQLRLRASGATLDAEDIDARLVQAAPSFQPRTLAKRHPDALQALRTAEYFHLPGASLPPGLDAAGPVLFWVKGLELWLNALLRPRFRDLVRPDSQVALAVLADRWPRHQDVLAPGWSESLLPIGRGNHFVHLGEALARELPRLVRSGRVASLRLVGAALLVLARSEALDAALPRDLSGLSRPDLQALANRLVLLAARRNTLTHEAAGRRDDNAQVRQVALEALGMAGRLRVGRR